MSQKCASAIDTEILDMVCHKRYSQRFLKGKAIRKTGLKIIKKIFFVGKQLYFMINQKVVGYTNDPDTIKKVGSFSFGGKSELLGFRTFF